MVTLKLYKCKVTFKKAKILSVEYLDSSHHRKVDLLPFMEGGPLYKWEPQSCMSAKSLLRQRKFLSGEYLDSSHHILLDLLSFIEGGPLYKREP